MHVLYVTVNCLTFILENKRLKLENVELKEKVDELEMK